LLKNATMTAKNTINKALVVRHQVLEAVHQVSHLEVLLALEVVLQVFHPEVVLQILALVVVLQVFRPEVQVLVRLVVVLWIEVLELHQEEDGQLEMVLLGDRQGKDLLEVGLRNRHLVFSKNHHSHRLGNFFGIH